MRLFVPAVIVRQPEAWPVENRRGAVEAWPPDAGEGFALVGSLASFPTFSGSGYHACLSLLFFR
jgi:hypothetical protein